MDLKRTRFEPHSCFQSRSCILICIASPVGYLPANKQNAVSFWTSCTESSLKGIHRPVSLLCLVFGSAPFAFSRLERTEPDLLGFCGWFACVSCQQLQTVDLSQTFVIELLGSTFAFCLQLQQLSLPQNLRIIEQEAFLKCTSLQEVCIPPSLLYIARRAFAGCAQLRTVRKKGKSKTWRGTCARLNAFDKCEQLDKPQWLRFLPPDANNQWREDFQEAIP